MCKNIQPRSNAATFAAQAASAEQVTSLRMRMALVLSASAFGCAASWHTGAFLLAAALPACSTALPRAGKQHARRRETGLLPEGNSTQARAPEHTSARAGALKRAFRNAQARALQYSGTRAQCTGARASIQWNARFNMQARALQCCGTRAQCCGARASIYRRARRSAVERALQGTGARAAVHRNTGISIQFNIKQ